MTRKQIVKLLFHRDLLMPFASLFFFFTTYLSLKDYGLKLNDLDKYVDVFSNCDSVVSIKTDKLLAQKIKKTLSIKLEDLPYKFIITSTDNFGYITSQINKGDTITIWTKTNKEKASPTNTVAINHLVYKDKILVDFDRSFAVTPALVLFSLIPAFGFLIWYYFKIKKRLRKIIPKLGQPGSYVRTI